MITIDPKTTPTRELHQYLLGSIAPRPIAFVSTIDENGNNNLAPYSFFNAFSSNPPILVFSSNRRVVDNTTKDTLYNIKQNKEVVINVVNYDIVRQMTIASIQFDKEISEFEKSGLTPLKSDLIAPARVKESPVQMECKVKDIITLGTHGGAGHLIICEVVKMHISKDVIDNNRINPHKIDLMGRMGRSYYVRASGDAIHTIFQPVTQITIGYDKLPKSIQNSSVLTGNNIGQLAGIKALPNKSEIEDVKNVPEVKKILNYENPKLALHYFAKHVLDQKDDRDLAIKVLMLGDL